MNLGIVGSRSFTNYELLIEETAEALETIPHLVDTIISGGAPGTDTLAERFAKEFGFKMRVILAEWAKFGKRAGMLRNPIIVDNSDKVIVFWDGFSKGAANTIDIAKRSNKLLKVIMV